ncbi:MAG: hypothetical protein KAG64_08965 [Bacteroidales bacterium]|nr:hypothetical protein [Bacteroidales bacterium]
MNFIHMFRNYYRIWFFIMGFLYIFVLVVRYFKFGDLYTDIILPTILFGAAAFLGGVFHFYYEFYQQRRISKLLLKFRALEIMGFELDEGVYSGYYSHYYTVATPYTSIDFGDAIVFNIMILPKEHQLDVLKDIADSFEIIANEHYFSLKVSIPLKFGKLPELEKIKSKLDPAIDTLVRNKIVTNIQE